MRGKRPMSSRIAEIAGITPARAGKTVIDNGNVVWQKDHPRACGENRPALQKKHITTRITPARAGKTGPLCKKTHHDQDHPRACGENRERRAAHRPAEGSPPRVRGKHDSANGEPAVTRITPARAGKTSYVGYVCGVAEDHPRACGENWNR